MKKRYNRTLFTRKVFKKFVMRAALNSIIAKLVERIPNLSAIDSEPLQIESITLESP